MEEAKTPDAPKPLIGILPRESLCVSLILAEKVYKAEGGAFIIAGAFNRLGVALAVNDAGWLLPVFFAHIQIEAINAQSLVGDVWVRILDLNGQPDAGSMHIFQFQSDAGISGQGWAAGDMSVNIGPLLIQRKDGRILHADQPNSVTLQVEVWAFSRLVAFRRVFIIAKLGGIAVDRLNEAFDSLGPSSGGRGVES